MAINWRKNQPIVFHIRDVLVRSFPFFVELGYAQHWTGIGGYVNRTLRHSGRRSPHAEGRAADIYLKADKHHEKILGDRLFHLFGSNISALGVHAVIWNRQMWSADKGGPRPIEGNPGPHDDHVHVSFTRNGSQLQPPLLTRLVEELRTALDAARQGFGAVRGYVEGQAREPIPVSTVSPYDCVNTVIVRPTPN